jgi:hypothetical protein
MSKGAEMLDKHYMQSVMHQLPKIAKALEHIAENTKPEPQHDFSAWNGDYSSFKEKYTEVFLTENMYAFLSVVFQSFQANGVEGVCNSITTHNCRRDMENALDPSCSQIAWCVGDFEAHAEYLESNNHDGEQIYDRSKFAQALQRMCDKHDAEYGINWETIEVYLDDCKLSGGE